MSLASSLSGGGGGGGLAQGAGDTIADNEIVRGDTDGKLQGSSVTLSDTTGTFTQTTTNGGFTFAHDGTGGTQIPASTVFNHVVLRIGEANTGFANEGNALRVFVAGNEMVRFQSSNFRVVAGGNPVAPDITSCSNGAYSLVSIQPDGADDDTGLAHGGNADEVVLAAGGAATVMGKFASGAARVGFLGATPAVQQTGGAATAGAAYTATEQAMLQAAYDCLRTFGLLT